MRIVWLVLPLIYLKTITQPNLNATTFVEFSARWDWLKIKNNLHPHIVILQVRIDMFPEYVEF